MDEVVDAEPFPAFARWFAAAAAAEEDANAVILATATRAQAPRRRAPCLLKRI